MLHDDLVSLSIGAVVAGAGARQLEGLHREGEVVVVLVIDQEPQIQKILIIINYGNDHLLLRPLGGKKMNNHCPLIRRTWLGFLAYYEFWFGVIVQFQNNLVSCTETTLV